MIIISTHVRGAHKDWTLPEYDPLDTHFTEQAIAPLGDYLHSMLERGPDGRALLRDTAGHPMSQVRRALGELLCSDKIEGVDLTVILDDHEQIRIELRKCVRELDWHGQPRDTPRTHTTRKPTG